jgi:DNA-binding beta-propeller fold protein YncE
VFTFGKNERQMRVLDIRDPGGFREVEDLGSPHQFALSRDGTRAYVRDGEAIGIVDVAAARLLARIATPGIEDSPLYLAPDQRRLFQFRPQGELVVFDVVERRELARMPVDLRDTEGLSASARVAFSPDGAKLYVVGSRTGAPTGPVRVLVLDAASLATIADRDVDVAGAPRLSRDGSPLALLDGWLAQLGFVAEAKEFGTVTQIALSPDGRRLYAARGGAGDGILLIDTERLEAVGVIESGRPVFGLQLSPDGERVYALAAAGGEATLVAVDTRSYDAVATASIRRTAADTSVILYKP